MRIYRKSISCLFLSFLFFGLNACTGSVTYETFIPRTTPTIPCIFTQIKQPTTTPADYEQISIIKKTQIASFSPTCDQPNDSSFSPQENWLAISCGCEREQTLQIQHKTGKQWIVHPNDPVEIQTGKSALASIYPIYWLRDESYLYFAPVSSLSRDGSCFYDGSGEALYRINLDDGEITPILLPLSGSFGYSFLSFSPSGTWLVYRSDSPTFLNVQIVVPIFLNLQTGKKVALKESISNIGDFAWSPDNSKLAYAVCERSDPYSMAYSGIKIFSPETFDKKTILESDNIFLRIDSEEELTLKIISEFDDISCHLFYDWSTEQLTIKSITPMP